MPSEKECVLRERDAFVQGVKEERTMWISPHLRAAKLYPLPKITRPRRAPDPVYPLLRWFVVGDALHVTMPAWGPPPDDLWDRDKRRVILWADLLQNPTEEVEVDA